MRNLEIQRVKMWILNCCISVVFLYDVRFKIPGIDSTNTM
jgi:hypothetical protein